MQTCLCLKNVHAYNFFCSHHCKNSVYGQNSSPIKSFIRNLPLPQFSLTSNTGNVRCLHSSLCWVNSNRGLSFVIYTNNGVNYKALTSIICWIVLYKPEVFLENIKDSKNLITADIHSLIL